MREFHAKCVKSTHAYTTFASIPAKNPLGTFYACEVTNL
jgi:hypothetical protein